jgi:hypothetical protein
VKATFPVDVPPMKAEASSLDGQAAHAALTQTSPRLLLIFMVALESTAFGINRAVPEDPVVDTGVHWHFTIEAAILP